MDGEHSVLRFVTDKQDSRGVSRSVSIRGWKCSGGSQMTRLFASCWAPEHINIDTPIAARGRNVTVGILKVGNPAKASKVLNGSNRALKRKASASAATDAPIKPQSGSGVNLTATQSKSEARFNCAFGFRSH